MKKTFLSAVAMTVALCLTSCKKDEPFNRQYIEMAGWKTVTLSAANTSEMTLALYNVTSDCTTFGMLLEARKVPAGSEASFKIKARHSYRAIAVVGSAVEFPADIKDIATLELPEGTLCGETLFDTEPGTKSSATLSLSPAAKTNPFE